ncbi:hypothetical protein ABPG75_003612 [Micractinium tetrahymenae]
MARRMAALLAPLLFIAAAVGGARGAEAPSSCRTYTSKGLIQPATGSLQDVIVVQDAFVVSTSSVSLDVSHRRIGALKITLTAQPFSSDASSAYAHPTITLKSHGLGRRGADLYHTTFSDSASSAFPVNASFAPFTGTYRPVQKLAFLTDGDQQVAGSGGSQGLWTLTVADVAPNNTLREIALNGWSLTLCPRGAAASPSPSPAVDGDLSSPPAPPVKDFSGPPDAASPPPPKAAAASPPPPKAAAASPPPPKAAAGAPTTIGGWTVVFAPAPQGSIQVPSAPSSAGAPAAAGSGIFGPAPGALAQPLQQLLEQRPVLTLLQQQIAAIVQGATTGVCDDACLQAKRQLWAAAAVGLYVHAKHKKHAADPSHVTLLDKLKTLLPNSGPGSGKLQDLFAWMDAHKADLQGLGQFLQDRLKLPALTVNGAPLTIPSGKEGLQQLMALVSSGGTDSVQKLMGAFAAAGDRLQQLASGLGSTTANNLQASFVRVEGNLFASSANKLASVMASGVAAQQAVVGKAAGNVDNKLTAINSFLSGLNGSTLDEVTAAGLAEFSNSIQSLFDFSSFA